MAHTFGMRATSLGVSAALLGLGVIAAFSVSIRLVEFDQAGEMTVTTFTERPQDDPPPARPIVRERPPPTAQEQTEAFAAPAADPLQQPVAFAGPAATFEGPLEITTPRWLRRPRDLGVYYPQRAEARGVTGEVELDCLVSTVGRLDCIVISETPRNWGFGQAALAIARDHRMAPATENGAPVQGRYRMRVPFEVR